MNKLLVLCCVVVGGVLAEPVPVQNELGERRLFGCRGQQQAGAQACKGVRAQLVAHPGNCRLFFYCTRFGPVCHRCPIGLHFNPTLHVCDWPKKAGCTANLHSSTTVTPASSTEPPASPWDPPTTSAGSTDVPPPASDSPSISESPSSEPPAVSELPSSSADTPAPSEPPSGSY